MAARCVILACIMQVASAELRLQSSSFGHNDEYPMDSRGNGDNVSPKLAWTGVPKHTESFVLIVDSLVPAKKAGKDPTQKINWIVYDIPKEVTEMRDELSGAGSSDVARLGMKEDAGTAPVVVDPMGAIDGWVDPEIKAMQDMIEGALDQSFEDRNRAKEGLTSYGGTYYRGPSKQGTSCSFKLYALSGRLELPRAASKDDIIKAIKGKVLGKATLTGIIR